MIITEMPYAVRLPCPQCFRELTKEFLLTEEGKYNSYIFCDLCRFSKEISDNREATESFSTRVRGSEAEAGLIIAPGVIFEKNEAEVTTKRKFRN